MTDHLDYAVFIGRCTPFHHAHRAIINKALDSADNVIVLLGSSNTPRCLRHPFTYNERAQMVFRAFPQHLDRLSIVGINDYTYNDAAWLSGVQTAVTSALKTRGGVNGDKVKIGLIGCKKDQTNYYLNLFPQWAKNSISVGALTGISGTAIRNTYFQRGHNDTSLATFVKPFVPPTTFEWLKHWRQNEHETFNALVAEREYIEQYRSRWANTPYPPTFNTADSVVTQSGHILLIERRAAPGKGLLALPGGFIDQTETALQAAVRELKEETKLKVPLPVLLGSLVANETFDNPNRSERGRIFTHCFRFDLAPNSTLPPVKGGSDAGKAFWLPISDLNAKTMFEDHYHIVAKMLERDKRR